MHEGDLERMPYGRDEPTLWARFEDEVNALLGRSDDADDHEPEESTLPATPDLRTDEVVDLFEESEGVYRQLPVRAWDPTIASGHADSGYVEGPEAAAELRELEDEWEVTGVDATAYHSEGLRCRGTLSLRYDGTLDADETIAVPFRADLEQYISEESAEEYAADLFDL